MADSEDGHWKKREEGPLVEEQQGAYLRLFRPNPVEARDGFSGLRSVLPETECLTSSVG